MRRSLFAQTFLFSLVACSSPGSEPRATASPVPVPAAEGASPVVEAAGVQGPIEADQVAYFAGGCFWGVEHFMEKLDGVVSVESGYMGGQTESPTYEQVSGHQSGHLEAVEVRFDSQRVSYETVAKLFFEIHDPTQADGQGPDIGSQYLSAVFYRDDEQKRVTESLIGRLKARGYGVVTALRPAGKFWPAEEYHQNYYAKTGKTPYCHAKVDRFGD